MRRVLLAAVMFGLLAVAARSADPETKKADAGKAVVKPCKLEWIRPSKDKSHFVLHPSNKPIVMWGFNYDRDDGGRLLEDYWAKEWDTVAADFREMKALRGNVVRIHLQLGRFMDTANHPNAANLQRLAKLVRLAEDTSVYLDITGLGCYHKKDVPVWYDALEESARWAVQARFWKEVAGVCKASPTIFCYDLMNEPIIGGADQKKDWLPGEGLGGKHYVQRITLDPRGRSAKDIAKAWVQTLATAIRSVDDRHMITVGVIPWAQVFKGARPLFYAPEVCGPLDCVSVHFYPKAVDVKESLTALKVYQIGKPLVIEEIFPLEAGVERTEQFIEKSRPFVDGYLSFYWGKTIDQNKRKGDLSGALMSQWLTRFRAVALPPKVKREVASLPFPTAWATQDRRPCLASVLDFRQAILFIIDLHAAVAPGSTQESSTNSGKGEVRFIFLFLAFCAYLFHGLPPLCVGFGVRFILDNVLPDIMLELFVEFRK